MRCVPLSRMCIYNLWIMQCAILEVVGGNILILEWHLAWISEI